MERNKDEAIEWVGMAQLRGLPRHKLEMVQARRQREVSSRSNEFRETADWRRGRHEYAAARSAALSKSEKNATKVSLTCLLLPALRSVPLLVIDLGCNDKAGPDHPLVKIPCD